MKLTSNCRRQQGQCMCHIFSVCSWRGAKRRGVLSAVGFQSDLMLVLLDNGWSYKENYFHSTVFDIWNQMGTYRTNISQTTMHSNELSNKLCRVHFLWGVIMVYKFLYHGYYYVLGYNSHCYRYRLQNRIANGMFVEQIKIAADPTNAAQNRIQQKHCI